MDASDAEGDLALIQTSLPFLFTTTWFTQQNQWGLYQNKVTSSLATIQRPGHWADNCKMVYCNIVCRSRILFYFWKYCEQQCQVLPHKWKSNVAWNFWTKFCTMGLGLKLIPTWMHFYMHAAHMWAEILFRLNKLPCTQALVFMTFQFYYMGIFKGMSKIWNNDMPLWARLCLKQVSLLRVNPYKLVQGAIHCWPGCYLS